MQVNRTSRTLVAALLVGVGLAAGVLAGGSSGAARAARPRVSQTLSYSCAVPVLGIQVFSATVDGSSPATVGAGEPLTVTGYTATTVIPANLIDDLIALGASTLAGDVTVADVDATAAVPTTLNAAATPVPFSVTLAEGQPADVTLPPLSVGPFTAGASGTIDISPGDLTIEGTFPVLGAASITCTPAAPPTPVVTSTTIVPGRLAVQTSSLPAGSVGVPYEAPLAAVGGTPPYTWSVTGGALPPGLTLGASTGIITGTPTAVDNGVVTVGVTDAAHPADAAVSGPLPLTVGQTVSPRTLTAWGQIGQPGNTLASDDPVPTPVALPAGVSATATASGVDDALALTSSGTVVAWGHNADGQLGDGTTTDRATPVAVLLPAGVTAAALSAGAFHNAVLTTAGGIETWGANYYGQLGDGTTTGRTAPVAVSLPGGATAVAVSAGGAHTLALTSTGAVWAWGRNADGQLGDGTTTDRDVPVAVRLPAGVTVTAIAAGGGHSLALTSTGSVLAWGAGGSGQLGDGTTTDRDVPVAVQLPAGVTVTAIAAGGAHSLALTSAGSVLAWGAGASGQLGDGTGAERPTPVAVDLPAGTTVRAVVAGASDSLALTSTGAIWSWGYNHYGQLGTGSRVDSRTPVPVDLPAGAAAIDLGAGTDANAALALLAPAPLSGTGYWTVAADGGLFAFGDAAYAGSMGGKPLNRPIVGMAAHAHTGYWLVAADGGVFAYGGAGYFGSSAASPLVAPVVGMAATPDGDGYWLVAADGGVFAYGDAGFHGSMGGKPLNRPIVGMAATPDGHGYWLVASDGGIFAFGDAGFHGSRGASALVAPVVGVAGSPTGQGYWLVAADGGIFAYGDAGFHGSMGGTVLNAPMVGIAPTPDGGGYWTVAADGGIFAFGTADYFGSMGGRPLDRPMVGMAGA